MITFKEWMGKKTTSEMTSAAGASGGATSTADIAGYARPLFSKFLIRRGNRAKKEDLPKVK
jgi:hypothetical protein